MMIVVFKTNHYLKKYYPESNRYIIITFIFYTDQRMIGKNIVTLIICLFLSVVLNGQKSVSDSLKNLLNNSLNDTTRLSVLLELGQEVLLYSPWEALDYYNQAKALSISIKDTNKIVENIIGICDVYSLNGEYKNALEQISEAMTYAGKNYSLLAKCHNRLSVEYDNLDKYEESVKHDRLALHYHTICNDSIEVSNDLHNIGTYHLRLKEADSAIYYYELSNKYSTDTINNTISAYNDSRIGIANALLGNYSTAIYYHLKALSTFKKYDDNFEIAYEYKHLANVYLSIDKKEKALSFVDSALKIAKEINNPNMLIGLYNIYFEYYLEKKNYEKALDYKILQQTYSDTLLKKNQESAIQKLKAQQQIEKQNKVLEITKLNNKVLKTKQRYLIIISIVSILLLILSILFLIENRIKNKKNKELLDKINEVNSFQKTLISIIGHDLINYVGSLKNFVELINSNFLEEKTFKRIIKTLVPTVNSTYDLLNNIIIWSKNSKDQYTINYEVVNTQMLIEETISQMKHLAQIKNISFKTNIKTIDFEADKNMLLTVLRNLISNAIKFSHPDSCIFVNSHFNENYIEFSIKDQGIGMNQDQIEKVFNIKNNDYSKGTLGESGSGLGLGFCRSFIEKHGGSISVKSFPDKGCTFYLLFPKNKHSEEKSLSVKHKR